MNRRRLDWKTSPFGQKVAISSQSGGVVVATVADPSIGEEIARRLNNSHWSDQEDQWAL